MHAHAAGLMRTPCCWATQSATSLALQVRVPLPISVRTVSSMAGVRSEVSPPRGLLLKASKPLAMKALIQARTVFSCAPRWSAILGTLQPASRGEPFQGGHEGDGSNARLRVRCRRVLALVVSHVDTVHGQSIPNPTSFGPGGYLGLREHKGTACVRWW
jgi:hypothetical protein